VFVARELRVSCDDVPTTLFFHLLYCYQKVLPIFFLKYFFFPIFLQNINIEGKEAQVGGWFGGNQMKTPRKSCM